MDYKDQVVLITGSTRGIGKTIAVSFAKEGATVVICGTKEPLAKVTCQEIIDQGFLADYFVCDITNLKNVEKMVNKILDKYKRIDILINNAGITKDNLLIRLKEDDWDAVLNVNLKGVFNCTKIVTKAMLKAKRGKVISIASIIGITGNIGQANYAASKAGIIGFSKSVARELASRGITANVVAPGYIRTEMTEQIAEKTQDLILERIPLKRFGTPEDVAGVCLFLASPHADYITGQTVLVDGGIAI